MPIDPPDDPLLWLEEIDGADALAWVDRQNAAAEAALRTGSFAADKAAALRILTAEDRIPSVLKRGAFLYNF